MPAEFRPGQGRMDGAQIVDQREALPRHGQVLYGFGTTSGTGEMIAAEWAREGGTVVMFTSQRVVDEQGNESFPSFDKAMKRMPRRKVDTDLFVPQYADQKRITDINSAFTQLRSKNMHPNKAILASAGGIDTFAQDFSAVLGKMNDIRRSDDPNKDDLIALYIEDLRNRLINEWVPASIPDAYAINFLGQVHTFKKLGEEPGEVDAIFLNSTFGHIGEGPPHYGSVKLKRKTTKWLEDQAPRYARQGKYFGEVVAPVIADTAVGTLIMDYMLPFYPPQLQEAIRNTAVTRKDVVEAVKVFWNMSPQEKADGPHPYTLFVTRDQGDLVIAQEQPKVLSSIDVSKFPF